MSEEPWHVHMEVAQRERDDDEDEHRLLPRLDVVCQRAQECQARVLLRHKRMPTEESSAVRTLVRGRPALAIQRRRRAMERTSLLNLGD